MRVGVARETVTSERRVAVVPEVVKKLVAKGHEVVVESGAGVQALIPDVLYTDAGATIGVPWSCDVVVKVQPPSDEEIARLGNDSILVGFLRPEIVERLKAAGVTAFAMES